jgi:hypothetical protein
VCGVVAIMLLDWDLCDDGWKEQEIFISYEKGIGVII